MAKTALTDYTTQDLKDLKIRELADIVKKDWSINSKDRRPGPAAAPYLDAMFEMDSADKDYHADSGKGVIIYFMGNAQSWRGEVAKAVKAELKRRIS